MNGTLLLPMEDALALGVVPQQIALIVGQFIQAAQQRWGRTASYAPTLT
jgi:hypothetical protein